MLPCVFIGAEQRPSSFLTFVTSTFMFGWVVGFAIVLKAWHLAHGPRWMLMMSGIGYVTFMLVPAATGFLIAWLARRLVTRGWGTASLRMLAAGVCGLVVGLFAL